MTLDSTKDSSATLRAARPDDLPAVLALLADASLPRVGVAESFGDFIVAERGGTIIGAVGLERCGDRYALLRSAVVAPQARGTHVGHALIASAIAAAESAKLGALYLLTTTAEAWFPKFGFVRVDRGDAPDEIQATDEFTSACPASAAVMMRNIGEQRA